MEELSAMAFDSALQRKLASVASWVILALSMMSSCAAAHAAQQPAAKRSAPKQLAKAVSPLLAEAEGLLREGRIAEAKTKIREELQRNPANAEGYNLLGVIYVSEKDYAGALEAFQQAVKLEPNSNSTRNSIAPRSANSNKPTRCSRKRWRFSTTWARPIYAPVNTPRPNWR